MHLFECELINLLPLENSPPSLLPREQFASQSFFIFLQNISRNS